MAPVRIVRVRMPMLILRVQVLGLGAWVGRFKLGVSGLAHDKHCKTLWQARERKWETERERETKRERERERECETESMCVRLRKRKRERERERRGAGGRGEKERERARESWRGIGRGRERTSAERAALLPRAVEELGVRRTSGAGWGSVEELGVRRTSGAGWGSGLATTWRGSRRKRVL